MKLVNQTALYHKQRDDVTRGAGERKRATHTTTESLKKPDGETSQIVCVNTTRTPRPQCPQINPQLSCEPWASPPPEPNHTSHFRLLFTALTNGLPAPPIAHALHTPCPHPELTPSAHRPGARQSE
ncbi:unnamed protein product [Pleuronectes platessa]|uniref:Uncharacterized protein n=1 Tax=Pleuronectes platessa TaxID=8262 RepID=A0A9N7W0E8_PLEPL|nr:unnamed protein product [Pleuronectes platessa]